jgi:hypothetical protein
MIRFLDSAAVLFAETTRAVDYLKVFEGHRETYTADKVFGAV